MFFPPRIILDGNKLFFVCFSISLSFKSYFVDKNLNEGPQSHSIPIAHAQKKNSKKSSYGCGGGRVLKGSNLVISFSFLSYCVIWTM